MFCQKCGGKNGDDAKFCSSCGEKLLSRAGFSNRKWLLTGIFVCLVVLIGISYTLLQMRPEEKVKVVESDPTPEQVTTIVKKESKVVEPVSDKPLELEKTALIKEAMPKVFTIYTEESLGSGFLYKEGGFIVTNAHVVAGYTDVVVRNSNGKDSAGKVIGISDHYDIALIRAHDYAKAAPLPVEENESSVGSEVIAIGSPQGFENMATVGYLTGIGRDIEYDFSYENIYQIDAQIDQGSSGGPLIDAKTGKVIGINSLLYTGNTSFGFSIPMYSMISVVDGWAKNPMSEQAVASLFGVYEDYAYYDESVRDETNSYYDDFWNDYERDSDNYDDHDRDADESYEADEDYEIANSFDDVALENFVLSFRNYYELALHDEEFYWISDMLLPGSKAYTELENYITEISGQGMSFDFISNAVTNIAIMEEEAIVTTIEVFDFMAIDGELLHYEREKDYHIIADEYGAYQIMDIKIYD